jgi:hypothetical protein
MELEPARPAASRLRLLRTKPSRIEIMSRLDISRGGNADFDHRIGEAPNEHVRSISSSIRPMGNLAQQRTRQPARAGADYPVVTLKYLPPPGSPRIGLLLFASKSVRDINPSRIERLPREHACLQNCMVAVRL